MTRTAASYARAIERRWSGLLERPVVLSPRDWALISDWYDRSIPLALVEEAIQSAAPRVRRGAAKPRGLSYVAPAVEEGWAAVVQGRVVEPAAPEGGAAAEGGREAWERCLREHAAGEPLAVLLGELLSLLDAGEVPGEVDARLDRELVRAVPPALAEEVAAAVEQQIAPFRGRMSGEVLEATRRRACVKGLRRRLGLSLL